jgi:hypothetical protein
VASISVLIRPKVPDFAKFPVKFPDNREFAMETGSHMTAHTTTQSSGIELRWVSSHLSHAMRAFARF